MTIISTRGRRSVVAAGAALSVVALLSGCTGAPQQAEGEKLSSITIPIAAQPPGFDPSTLDLGESSFIWSAVYETLLYVDENNEIQPNAAESYEYSADAKTLTFTLRDDLTFSTGEPVTAQDAAATIEYSRTTPGPTQATLASVAGAEATDDHTLVISLSQPDAALLTDLALSAGVIAPADTLGDGTATLDPVGSGPYVLDMDASVSGSSYVLTKRDDYWNADAYDFDSFTVRVFEDTQAIFNALQANELDTGGNVTPDQEAPLEAAGYRIAELKATAIGGLFILDKNGAVVPALADVRVRQAINMAIDRQLYIDSVLQGRGSPTEQIFNPLSEQYDPKLDSTYSYDVDGAKELLAEAGYPDGFDVSMPSTFLTTTVEPAITKSLSDIGITVTWEPTPPQDIVSSLFSGKYGMAFFYAGGGSSAREVTSVLAPGGYLTGGYADPELVSLVDAVSATIDPAAQLEAYRALNTYTVENALHVPFYAMDTARALSPGLEYLPAGATSIQNIRFYTTN